MVDIGYLYQSALGLIYLSFHLTKTSLPFVLWFLSPTTTAIDLTLPRARPYTTEFASIWSQPFEYGVPTCRELVSTANREFR